MSAARPIIGYFIEVSSDDGSSWTVVRKNTGSTGTAFKHEGLTRATVYTYRVAAINKIGTGEKSEVAVAKTLAVVPTPPRYLEAEAKTSTRIDLESGPNRKMTAVNRLRAIWSKLLSTLMNGPD